jgi:hypothetical protein
MSQPSEIEQPLSWSSIHFYNSAGYYTIILLAMPNIQHVPGNHVLFDVMRRYQVNVRCAHNNHPWNSFIHSLFIQEFIENLTFLTLWHRVDPAGDAAHHPAPHVPESKECSEYIEEI